MSNNKLIKKPLSTNLKEDFRIAILNQIKSENANPRDWKRIIKFSILLSCFILFRPYYLERKKFMLII